MEEKDKQITRIQGQFPVIVEETGGFGNAVEVKVSRSDTIRDVKEKLRVELGLSTIDDIRVMIGFEEPNDDVNCSDLPLRLFYEIIT